MGEEKSIAGAKPVNMLLQFYFFLSFFKYYFCFTHLPQLRSTAVGSKTTMSLWDMPQGGGMHPVLFLHPTGKLKLLLPGRQKVKVDQLWVRQAKCFSKYLFFICPFFSDHFEVSHLGTQNENELIWWHDSLLHIDVVPPYFLFHLLQKKYCCLIDFDRQFLLKQKAITSTRGRASASGELSHCWRSS